MLSGHNILELHFKKGTVTNAVRLALKFNSEIVELYFLKRFIELSSQDGRVV